MITKLSIHGGKSSVKKMETMRMDFKISQDLFDQYMAAHANKHKAEDGGTELGFKVLTNGSWPIKWEENQQHLGESLKETIK